jgi:phage tail sheath protein FI
MPEYLAPGVYVEEIDTGSKPIEGVSTSTAGMLGATERGPVNVPILITGIGEYTRWFGERLSIADYSDPATGFHCYLPHAVEGFFTNGGKRVYVLRVLDTDLADRAASFLFNRGVEPGANTILLRAMEENTGTAANPPFLLVLPDPELGQNDWIRIGDGSNAEYRRVTVNPVVDTVAVPLSLPLSRSHADPAAAIVVQQITPDPPLATFTLVVPAPANRLPRGEQTIEITGTQANVNALIAAATPPLEIIENGAANIREHRFALQVTLLSPTNARVLLDSPLLLSYANGATVNHMDLTPAPVDTANLAPSARAGDSLLLVDDRDVNFDTRIDVVVITQANNQEIRRIGELRQVTFTTPITEDYLAGTLVESVNLADDNRIHMNAANAGHGTVANPITLVNAADAAELSVGQTLILGTGANQETVVIQVITIAGAIQLQNPLNFAKNLNDPVIPVRSLTAPVRAGANFMALTNRRGLAAGDVLRIGTPNGEEYVTIRRLPNRAATGPDPGNVIFAPPLTHAYPQSGTPVVRQNPVTVANVQPSVLVLDAPQGADTVLVSDGGGGAGTYAANTFVRLTAANTEVFYHHVSAISPAALVPQMVTLHAALRRSHRPGAPVMERQPLLLVQALDAGAWGNRLRVSVEDEAEGLVVETRLAQVISPTQIRLASSAGVEAGTVLEFFDAAGDPVDNPVKVAVLNRATGEITLGAALTVAQQVVGLGVRSREFRLTVYLLRQPDPLNPTRNETVLDFETFRWLSMDPRHSRYVQTVIGTTWDDVPGATQDHAGRSLRREDRRPEGESWYIRVRDWAFLDPNIPNEDARQAVLESVRLGPETLMDVLSDGRTRPARHRLEETLGDDSIASLTDNIYLGVDHPTPEFRTGLYTLRNIEEISIVACPGRTSVQIQNALIAHCELMRYRFTVLDSPRPPGDAIADVRTQRQQFDTKYAALYYPWLTIPDPYPTSLARIAEYPIPSSGHVLGVYARTDIERGVHKAPANEVVRGILGLQRMLTKEQHDILNPYPVNINVIRDFRDNNRGIRVFGGRVITSDSDWKYVNVRRLLIFIEASIDRGLQWVVFEPNAEPLWARVRRSITNFLTLVWRNGALEGTKVEEAFFVKCDRTTMTQTDIDSGRLIVLVGVAPVKPAEFVIIRIGLWTARADN